MDMPEIKHFNVDDITPAEYNPRAITESNLAGLCNSIQQFGVMQLPVVNIHDGKNVLIDGHQRLKTFQKLGIKEIPCIVVDFDETTEKACNISLNNEHIQGHFTEQLDSVINELREQLPSQQFLDLQLELLSKEIQERTKYTPEKPEVEFTTEVLEANNYVVFVFDNILDWQAVSAALGIVPVKALDSKEGYTKQGVGRVMSGQKLIDAIGLNR